jgi:hypothetical protein
VADGLAVGSTALSDHNCCASARSSLGVGADGLAVVCGTKKQGAHQRVGANIAATLSRHVLVLDSMILSK